MTGTNGALQRILGNKAKNSFFKIVSIALIAAMLFSQLPWAEKPAEAFDADNFYVTGVTIGKTFDSSRLQTSMYITIEGRNIKDANVQVFVSGQPRMLTNPKINTDDTLYFEFTKPADWAALKGITKITVGGASISIGDKGNMPAISGINPMTVTKGEGSVTIYGSDLSLVNSASSEFTVSYGRGIAFTKIDNSLFTSDSSVTLQNPTGELGLQDIVIERKWLTDDITFNSAYTRKVNVNLYYRYSDQFRLVSPLNISGDLEMFPNRGPVGSTIYFKAGTLSLYDVFFLKKVDGTDAYTASNKGVNPTYKMDAEGEKDILAVEVPNLEKGEYYVVLTNKVPDGADPMDYVTGEKVLDQKFTVIDGYRSARIDAIQPNTGPDTGSPAVISGRYLGSLNIDDLIMESGVTVTDYCYNEQQDHPVLVRTWRKNGEKVASYGGKDITEVTKKITVIVGNMATFREDSSFSAELDKISIMVSPITIDDGNYVRDVVVETETTLKYDTGQFVFTERAQTSKAYTFIPSTVKPEVQSATPSEIYVRKNAGGKYVLGQDLLIAVTGKNILIHRYNDEIQGFVTRYPTIQFSNAANKVVLDKNSDPNLTVYVEDSNGNILDGSTGNELGTRIVAVIPEGTEVPEAFIGTAIPVIITNPIRNSSQMGLSSDATATVKFLLPSENKIPVIESVSPDVVTVDGGETVTVKGTNFQDGVKVYIAGREVSGIARSGDGRTITLKAPSGKEGKTQLQILNPGGGMAVWDFYYVKTYTDPKIADFAPKAGNTGTLVQVKGDNFLLPDPTATADEIYKLIGTRILLEGQDINQYNIDSATKKIVLRDYLAPLNDEIIRVEENTDGGKYVKVADYWHSVLLKDENANKFYTISFDSQGNPVISDGASTTYKVGIAGGGLVASQVGGSDYSLTVEQGDSATEIVIGSLRLVLQTPFKVENGVIVGDMVKVMDKNTIIFKVPILTLGDGWYDLTVINPDTKKDSRTNEQGFYYYTQPQSRPSIEGIVPDSGSVDGGYTVDILGKEFYDDGTNKSRVFIDGVEVAASDTSVSIDGKKITVKVPPFSGELSGTDRKTVPVVVLNPDGSSAGKEDGFTYVVPTSHPKITKIVPQKGNAAGGDIVEITGQDFRYFEPFSDDDRDQIKDDSEAYRDKNGNNQWDDFRGKTVEELKQLYPDGSDYDKYVVPVLPKVYFGSKTARVLEFSDGYLKVAAPSGTAGDVEVYVVNNDSGISNSVKFTYQSSNPTITSIVPSEGKKQGGDQVEIFGRSFAKSNPAVYGGSTPPEVLVRFGDITNKDIPREQENSGRIDNGRTTVNLDGGLKVQYADGQILLEISEKGLTYSSGAINYDGSVLYFPTRLLSANNGTDEISYSGKELIRLEISDRRLYVERGYAPEAELVDSGHLVVTTPNYYTIGIVNVYVINPDGGTAKGKFEYKNPASSPVIVNLLKEGNGPQDVNINGRDVRVIYLTYKGGNTVSVIGSDFRENAKIQVSDLAAIAPKDITYMLPTKMTFTMPAVPESAVGKLHRLVVVNEDGGTASSDAASPRPIYIMFIKGETAPTIEKITPDHGPAAGGTTVKITGKDFREGLKVYFGGVTVQDSNVTVVDYKTITVVAPSHDAGKIEVKVENPDGELSNSVYFTYISGPKITAVVDPDDSTETSRITSISIEGGQEIKIKGSGFVSGARVVFYPEIEETEDESSAVGTVIYIDGAPYALTGGAYGSSVRFIDSETLTVVTPQGKVGAKGVMIINPDGGATDIYENLVYGLPKLEAPLNVRAELVYDRYIRINWSKVENAVEYEIYVVIDENETEFVGSTKLTSYLYTDLEPSTKYKFIVKAIGPFGSSQPSDVSNTVKTGSSAGPEDEDGNPVENTRMIKSGDTVNVIIGYSDYRKETVIDITIGELAGAKKVVVSIPAQVVVKKDSGNITITGVDFTVKLNPSAFNTSKLADKSNRNDAGVRFEISPYAESSDMAGKVGLSTQYELKAGLFVGNEATSMEYLASRIQLIMEYDSSRAALRKVDSIALSRYDDYKNTWERVAEKAGNGATSLAAYVERLGRYMIIGSRR
ncbi:MAG: IPT/TIG domain-containing protein [Tepidanaerobacteraceae bacterium]|nr:IPT/TIG domain-containing protein [Tepidanaerobacteraceae bacterium]